MPSFSSNYLLPAILLNPPVVLHLINTFISHLLPPPPTLSQSPNPFMENLGPLPGSTPYLDMHADTQLCWGYTAIMVIAQILAFGSVSDNRIRRKSAKAAKLERERLRKEQVDQELRIMALGSNGRISGLDGAFCYDKEKMGNGNGSGVRDGEMQRKEEEGRVHIDMSGMMIEEGESDESLTETSEEEIFS